MSELIVALSIVLMFAFGAYKVSSNQDINECLADQVKLYADLCAEEYEEVDSSLAHEQGVKCAVESVKACLESK